jgi:hypothetical protein
VLPDLDAVEKDVLVGWPAALDLALHLRPRRLIYDCLDLFPSFFQGPRRWLIEALEDELGRAAWGVVVTSRLLERRWTRRHPRVVRIPNGVELAAFWPKAEPPPVPPDVACLARPRLGYVGTVGRWLDLPLLVHVARQRPDCSLILLGPLERGFSRPPGPGNLHFLGERTYTQLPAYLAAIDVLLIPFRLMELTHAVNPIKLYEYCATGKPIVSTPLEEVVACEGVCHIGEGPHSFLRALDAALAEVTTPDPRRIALRQALAKANTWDHRVAAFTTLLDEPDQ